MDNAEFDKIWDKCKLQDAARLYIVGLHTHELECHHITISDTSGWHLELNIEQQ